MKIKKTICILGVFILAGTLLSAIPSSAEVKTTVIKADFTSCTVSDEKPSELPGTKLSYISSDSRIKVITGSDAINGKSLYSEGCDLRWWSVNNYDKKMYFGITVRLLSPGKADLRMGISTQSPKVRDEITDGALFRIADSNGTPVLRAPDGSKLANLSYNENIMIAIEVDRGSKTYTVKVNGETVTETCEHADKIYKVGGMRLSHFQGTVVMDDIYFMKSGTVYPQRHSMQPIGDTLNPDDYYTPADYTETHVYFNGIRTPVITGKGGEKITFRYGDFCKASGTNAVSNVRPGKKVSLSFIKDVLDADIWYDEKTNTAVVTTGEYKTDNILRVFRGKMYMNGKPFYEISFNIFDLFWQVYASHTGIYPPDFPDDTWAAEAAEESLSQLHDMGFKTIRVFCSEGGSDTVYDPDKKEAFFGAMEEMFAMCTKYDIKVVVCMNLFSSKFAAAEKVDDIYVLKDENELDLVANPQSESRTVLKNYLKEFITEFKDNPAVLFWEINNEGNLCADVGLTTESICVSTYQLAEFYADLADVIREADPVHMITTGDSCLRGAQWNLLQGVLEGRNSDNWNLDTPKERRAMLSMLNEKYDIISMHTYDTGLGGEHGMDNEGNNVVMTTDLYMEDAYLVGKPLYAGETNVSTGIGDRLKDMDTADKIRDFLDTYIDAGVQLTHWWAFHTDRRTQYDTDLPIGLRPGNEVHEAVLKVIQEENAKLKEKYSVNGFTYVQSKGYDAVKSGKIILPIILSLSALLLGGACFAAVKKAKKKR